MKTNELKDALLDYWVARAEGVSRHDLQIGITPTSGGRKVCIQTDPNGSVWMMYEPSSNWSQGGILMTNHQISVEFTEPGWLADESAPWASSGDTPLQAICRAIVRSKFGPEVEDKNIRGL